MARPKTDARERLLVAAVDAAATHGLSALSLRQLAEHLGTSHRMLLFHFGTKEGLLLEIVRHMEAQQREFLVDLPRTAGATSSSEQMMLLWDRLKQPAMWPFERLFFELYAQGLQGVEPGARLLAEAIEPWVATMAALLEAEGAPLDVARADARLALAVCRGALLDLVATGDIAGVDAAMARFAQLYTAGRTPRR